MNLKETIHFIFLTWRLCVSASGVLLRTSKWTQGTQLRTKECIRQTYSIWFCSFAWGSVFPSKWSSIQSLLRTSARVIFTTAAFIKRENLKLWTMDVPIVDDWRTRTRNCAHSFCICTLRILNPLSPLPFRLHKASIIHPSEYLIDRFHPTGQKSTHVWPVKHIISWCAYSAF